MEVAKVAKVGHKALKQLVKQLLLIDEAAHFTLRKDVVSAAVYTQARDTALLRKVPLAEVFELDAPLKHDLRIGLFKGVPARLLKYLDNFDPEETRAEIHHYHNKGDGHHYAQRIDLRDAKLKMTVHCADPGLGFVEMTDAQADKAFSDPAALYRFQLGEEDMGKLSKLSGFLQDENHLLSLQCTADGKISISSDVFEMQLPDAAEVSHVHDPALPALLFKKFMDRMPVAAYRVSVYKTKAVMQSADLGLQLAINLAIRA